ncbi:MAG: tetratricopeptide repeat protein, partial [Planctomycetes bacterium]|nr:tetratricopeptide repeat protein [Planctomycetota bacterium]
SPWLRRSRFAKAVALARKGDFQGAEQIYRAEAEFLLSQDRKQEIADIYLEFADAYFKPAKKEKEPDYQKALEFFTHALAVGPKPEKQVEIELLVAECHQQLQQFAEAAALYEKFTKDHPDSPLDVDARFRLGTCQLAQGQLKEARRSWQDLLAKHAASDSKWVAEAAYQVSRTWRIPAPESDEELSAGVAVLEAFVQRFPDHQLASKSLLDLAASNMHRGRPEDAAAVLNRFLADQRYAGREEVPAARHLLGRAYRLQKKFDEALTAWRDYLAKHPADKAWSETLREVIDTEYMIGEEQAQAEQYAAARETWSAFLTKYPLDDRSPRILYDFGHMNFQQEKWSEAIADWEQLASKYPETNEASQGLYMIGFVLEEKLGKLEESLEQYKKVTQGSHADQAKQAIARLTAKSLVIATDRVFRSDETPHITLTARNIENVSVRVYNVDLQTYFRKMHFAQGLEQLDVSLIDPDATFEFAVPGYARYQKFQCDVPVPLPAPLHSGVAAVTVSSDTLEATTMLIQSDLDVIVKSSRDELFVFAENMLTGQPWPAARLLISDGKNVFAEAATGGDGVFQQAYDELKTAEDVRVFATVDTHTASNVVR